MNRKTLLKLIVCDAALALLTLGYSLIEPLKLIPWTDWSPAYYDMFGGMATAVVFSLLSAAFTWAAFQAAKACRRWQMVMILNALICMAAGLGLGWLLFYNAGIFMLTVFAFMRIMFWCGAVTIVLSFPLKRMRRKGLVG